MNHLINNNLFSGLWGKITGKDARKKYPVQQSEFLDRTGNVIVLYPYGLYCDLPNDVLLSELSTGTALPFTVARPDDAARGEVTVFHPVNLSRVIFKDNGDIDVISNGGDVNITATNINVNGNLIIAGSLVTHNGTDISDTHVHTGVQSGASNTGVPA